MRAHQLADTLHQADSDSDSDDEFFSFTDGRAPDMGQELLASTTNDLDWVDKFFDLIAPETSQAPDRNAFNHLFDSNEPVDPHAWDDDLSGTIMRRACFSPYLHFSAVQNDAHEPQHHDPARRRHR